MGVPRKPIQLTGTVASPRVLGVELSDEDYTQRLRAFGERTSAALGDVCGYVFTQRSPSCGLFRVKVYPAHKAGIGAEPIPGGRGVHAAAVIRNCPNLPVEENGRLQDRVLRENFVIRTFVYAHWQALQASSLSAGKLQEFHECYRYLLMAHSVEDCQDADELLAESSGDLAEQADCYFCLLMSGLAHPAGRRGHAKVLLELLQYVGQVLDAALFQEMSQAIEGYVRGERLLIEPLSLLRRHFPRHSERHSRLQGYLYPLPAFHSKASSMTTGMNQ